jgi:SAM-dependent methyltransferase/uncharacterized protein YbaR (Trm112 family)
MPDRIDAFDFLACPVDGEPVQHREDQLVCPQGHSYYIVQGVPVMLRPDVEHTIGLAHQSLELAKTWHLGHSVDPLFIESLGVSSVEKDALRARASAHSHVDPVIAYLIAATNGNMYTNLIGNLDSVPIPELRMPTANGEVMLDIGCSWGRWSMAAGKKGYRPIGIDPSLGAVLAARRLAKSLDLPFDGVVGDARYLPFKSASIDCAFSYSVVQHFSKSDARMALRGVARVTKPQSLIKIQMASALGVRSVQHIVRRRMRRPQGFEVRYWLPRELIAEFRQTFGEAHLEADCYFGLGLQPSDVRLLSKPRRLVVKLSEILRSASTVAGPLASLADSVYVTAHNSRQLSQQGAR